MTDAKNRHAFDYAGERVEFTHRHEFYVVSLERAYVTAQQAKDAIDRAEAAKQKVARPKLALAVIDDKGKQRTIMGVHAGHGHKVLKPPVERYSRLAMYPDSPTVAALLVDLEAAMKQVSRLESALRLLRLEDDPYSRNGCVDLASRYVEVERDYAEKAKLAAKLTPEQAVAKAAKGE